MLSTMLADVICKTFETTVGRDQDNRQRKANDSGPKFVLKAMIPSSGELEVAQFTTEERAEAYRRSCFHEDEARPGYKPNSLLEEATSAMVSWKRCPPVDPQPLTPHALLVKFKTRIDYDKEEGYRYMDLVVYAPMNYVQVWVRTRWNVIPNEDLEYDEASGDSYIKPGKSYQEGASEWKCLVDHDSVWRDRIRQLLLDAQKDLVMFEGLGNWYEVVEVEKLNLPEKTR